MQGPQIGGMREQSVSGLSLTDQSLTLSDRFITILYSITRDGKYILLHAKKKKLVCLFPMRVCFFNAIKANRLGPGYRQMVSLRGGLTYVQYHSHRRSLSIQSPPNMAANFSSYLLSFSADIFGREKELSLPV